MSMLHASKAIEIVEVSPRDGLQNESRMLSTHDKLELIDGVVVAGVRRVEVTSFVRPDVIPQLADAEEVMAGLNRVAGVTYTGLVLNRRGAERALGAGVDELNFVVPVTDEFASRNQGGAVDDCLRALEEVLIVADASRTPVTVTLAVAFGCPFRGEVSGGQVVSVARAALECGPVHELALADTIGSGVPVQVTELFGEMSELTGLPLRAHFHDTRRTGLANALAAIASGVRILDASAAGLGGCPFAPGAAGNVATEELLWLLGRSGFETGIDPLAVAAVGAAVCSRLGTSPRSWYERAEPFPALANGSTPPTQGARA